MPTTYVNPAARDHRHALAGAGAREFHRSLPGYAPTPLRDLPSLAADLQVGRVLVKDESSRLGLPAFKILGASWACRRALERQPGAELVTATDGNHGRAVARMAAHFGVSATIFVPGVMLAQTAAAIEAEGARVERIAGDYMDAVREAAHYVQGAPSERVLLQDTAFPGYTEIPGWIVEGYRTLLEEIDEALPAPPDLVVVPVGVGSLAEAVVTHYRRAGIASPPAILSVEPDTAGCVWRSLTTGAPATVTTGATVMAGLNCGTISDTAWPILRGGCDAAVLVTDEEALRAVDDLEALGMSSGACGAATLAGARALLADEEHRRVLGLGPDCVVVLLSTEANAKVQR